MDVVPADPTTGRVVTELSELLGSLPRLKVVAFLDGCREAEFGMITDLCEMNKSTLSKAMTVLEAAGYITITKGYVGRRPKTWLALTDRGRTAYHEHLNALTALTQQARKASGEPDSPSGRS
ncbi:transcriptional regulator [Nocardia sp. NPDC051981]|uniref:transcriptional regulator n=1 Tax=Nocardia sp. NPDC051981 TaxID=3155417 RepID=UPI00344A1D2A